MAEITVVRKGTTTNKLTIAKDRIELKVTDQVGPLSEIWLYNFAQKVVDEVAKNPSQVTLRGRFKRYGLQQQLSLQLGWGFRGQKDLRYFYSDQMSMSPVPEDIR